MNILLSDKIFPTNGRGEGIEEWHTKIKAQVCKYCALIHSCKDVDSRNKCSAFNIFNFIINKMKVRISYNVGSLKFVYGISEMIMSSVVTNEKNLVIKNWDAFSAQICQECHLAMVCKYPDPSSKCEAFSRIEYLTRLVYLFQKEIDIDKEDFTFVLKEALRRHNIKSVPQFEKALFL